MAALGICGCAGPAQTRSEPASTPSAAAPASAPPAVVPPAPEALTAVLDRLSDPGVPGGDKLVLIQDGAPPDAETIDRFATALRDGGFAPPVFAAADITAGAPGEVLATVTVTPSQQSSAGREDRGDFVFPLAFREGPAGWQLTRETAQMLLAFPPGA